jgi:hypothetical protein
MTKGSNEDGFELDPVFPTKCTDDSWNPMLTVVIGFISQRKLDIKEFLVFMTPFGREQAASMWIGIEDNICLTSINLPAGVSKY